MKNKVFDRDFFPHMNIIKNVYKEYLFWTGFYSSRPKFKKEIRELS